MTMTSRYTRIHRAFTLAARAQSLKPMEVRALVALADREGVATSQNLIDDVQDGKGAAVRRALLVLDVRRYVTRQASDGGRLRPGVMTRVQITSRGQRLVDEIREAAGTEGDPKQ